MDQVTHRLPPDFVWPTTGHSGRVPLWALVPTPDQPRLDFDEVELNALADTMRSEHGGDQLEILTVRELNEQELIEHAPARYMVKSGERRWRAASLAGLDMLEIRVKRWSSVAKEMFDTWMFNENRVNLSFYENALYLAKVIKEFGWTTQAEVVRGTGKDAMWVSDHMAFAKLHPAVQQQMHPKVAKNQRYKRETAVFFARFDKEIQLDLHTRMPAKFRTVQQQIGWMNQYLTGRGIPVPMRGREPRKLRELVVGYGDYVERKAAAFLAAGDLERLFENTTGKQKYEILECLKKARKELDALVEKAAALAYPDASEAPQEPAPAKPAQSPSRAMTPAIKAAAAKLAGMRAPAPNSAAPQGAANGREKTVSYYDDTVGRIVTRPVTQTRYIELFEARKLGFQHQDIDRPNWMPTLDEAKNNWDHYCRK